MKKIHLIHYGPGPTSITDQIVKKLKESFKNKDFQIDELDLIANPPVIYNRDEMEHYVTRNYKGEEPKTESEDLFNKLDNYTERVKDSDLLILVFPMYNFTVPAAIKAWIDNVAQPKKLFKYTDYGPVGLANVQKTIVVPITGSTPQNSSKDFLTPYMEHILKFIGVEEVVFQGIYGSRYLGEDLEKKIDEVVENVVEEIK